MKNEEHKVIIIEAVKVLKMGGVIAYPTEGVFGLGCDPFNEAAVNKVLNLKHRSIEKGLILITSKWEQVENLIAPLDSELLAKILTKQASPTSWALPATSAVPFWIIGNHHSVLIRITEHLIAQALCDSYDRAIVSTSANVEGMMPAHTISEVKNYFPQGIDFIVDGSVGNLKRPTIIKDALTGKVLRG